MGRFRLSNFDGRFLCGLCLALAFCAGGCATRPTVYKAPDNSKVTATTKRLAAAIDRENETRVRAEAKVEKAQQSSDRVAVQSASVLNLIRELKLLVPEELKPKVEALESAQNEELQDTGVLSVQLADVRGEITQLRADQAFVVREKDQLKEDQAEYQASAERTAQAATAESADKSAEIDRIKGQLVQQKIWKWVWRIGGGAVVIGIVALFLTGKISIAAIRAYFHI
jgi:chromosome segregation ATPase